MSLILRDPTLVDTALCAMNLIEGDLEQWREFTGSAITVDAIAAECWSYTGPKWAICDETGTALAVAGCRLVRRGVYQSWFLSGTELWAYGKKVTEITRQVMLQMLDVGGAHRIETICLESRHQARSWYEAVGLHFEAVFPNYGVSGANAVQYAIYRTPEQ
jgi:hypothetical protein